MPPQHTISGPVFVDILTKILALVDGVLDIFVSTSAAGDIPSGSCCHPTVYTANITDCGNGLVCLLGDMTMAVAGFAAGILQALGATQM